MLETQVVQTIAGGHIKNVAQVVIVLRWTAVAVAASFLLPLAANWIAPAPPQRLFASAAGGLFALLGTVALVSKFPNRRHGAVAGTLVFLAYAVLMSSVHRRRLELPEAAVASAELEEALTLEARAGIYDLRPRNYVTQERVAAGLQCGGHRVHIVINIIWSREDWVIRRRYRGDVRYAARYAADRDGRFVLEELTLEDYSVAPSSGVIAYLIGFIEVELMMQQHEVVLDHHVISASRRVATSWSCCSE